MDEVLTGGNSNAPVRRGDTVLREAGPWTPTIHALLRHVRDRGVGWVPRPLGRDESGREVLTFLPGSVPGYPMPAEVWSDALLEHAGRLMRQYHDATLDFPLEDRTWQQPAHQPVEVVCHNDFAPYNFALQDGRITGVIDFDMASPGPRAWDLAYLAYRLVPLTAPGNVDAPDSPLDERRRRLTALSSAYGRLGPAEVLALAPRRLLELADYSDLRAREVGALAKHAALYRGDAEWITQEARRLD
jgi:Ser/Thr protein kinase RdoA (MazF antagonist)